MKYLSYTANDFVLDEYFQQWVFSSDPATDAFWADWLDRHPDKEEVILEAIGMARSLRRESGDFTFGDMEQLWDRLSKSREALENRGKGHGTNQVSDGLFPFETGETNDLSPLEDDVLRPDFRELTNQQLPDRPKRNLWRVLLKVAAVVLPLVALAYGAYQLDFFGGQGTMAQDPNRITLELQDGSIKVMDEAASGIIANKDGQPLGNQDKNILTYQRSQDNVTELVYNELTVPYGKNFELVLSDGSHIYLNAGSKLRYPVQFPIGKPRNVFLDGEAFFDVARDSARSPFTVVTDMLNTQVYGTRFNVSSYKEEENTFTVLEEGSVGVYQPNSPKKEDPVMIVPGQRAVFEDGVIHVEKVDIRKYTAWTKGELYFMQDRFELVLKELERHFNVRIDNQYPELNDVPFNAIFTHESLEKILELFQVHSPFSYEKNGNVITIKKPTEH